MSEHGAEEAYRELRATIRARGTAKVCIFLAGLSIWSVLALTIFVTQAAPVATIVPLLILAAAFEAVFSLHVGVERVGRYLQVFHEDRWEHVAMSFGAPLAGTGTDPLFAALFSLATVCNFIPVLVVGPASSELAGLGLFHAMFLVRLAAARRTAKRQRAADLERFRQLRATMQEHDEER